MKIAVLLNTIKIYDFQCNENVLIENIRTIWNKFGDVLDLKECDVSIHNGKINNAKIAILLVSEKIINNQGKLIVEFKKSFIELCKKYGVDLTLSDVSVQCTKSFEFNFKDSNRNLSENNEFDYEQKAKQFIPVQPLYSFDRVILPEETHLKLREAIGILECENKVFKEWGLYEIQPHPSTSLSFFGAPGTGKTMAADAIANKLGKKILKVSYADVESKFHGEGPKMVKAIFLAAEKEDAVLFFDEADSLLSKRLTNVSQGSEQAINSMRSQLLICLENFKGIVIFATNLVVNYDQAFLTRLISIEFKIPDAFARERIWKVHLKAPNDGKEHKLNIPLSTDVDVSTLAKNYEFVGREIRNAVVSACVKTALDGRNIVMMSDFISACDSIEKEKKSISKAKDFTQFLSDVVAKKIKEKSSEGEEDVFTDAK